MKVTIFGSGYVDLVTGACLAEVGNNVARDIILADETTFQVLKEAGRAPQTDSWLWCYRSGSGPPIILFEYSETRAGKHPQRYLEGALAATCSPMV